MKDEMTFLHSNRVTKMMISFAEFLRLSKKELKLLELGGLLHDIGKLDVSTEILNKPGKLSYDEFTEIQKHPKYGWEFLDAFTFEAPILDMALHHHEKWDGSGYPAKLDHQNIPYFARVLALADSLEAMTGIRPYRASLSWYEASLEIEKGIGTQFDPEIASQFLIWMKQIVLHPIENKEILYSSFRYNLLDV